MCLYILYHYWCVFRAAVGFSWPKKTMRAAAQHGPSRNSSRVRDVNPRFTSSRGRGEYHSCGVIEGTATVWFIIFVLRGEALGSGETPVHITPCNAMQRIAENTQAAGHCFLSWLVWLKWVLKHTGWPMFVFFAIVWEIHPFFSSFFLAFPVVPQ